MLRDKIFAYCKSGNFIFANNVKRRICHAKNLRLGYDFPISVNNRVISPFCKDFIFTKLRICKVSRKLNPHENFQIYSSWAMTWHDKTSKMSMSQAKTQISLGILPVWLEYLLCTKWVTKATNFLYAGSEDPDLSELMPKLIRVFLWSRPTLLVLPCGHSSQISVLNP